MKRIGLTGGIGSGKSTVLNIFRSLNVPVFEADFEAKKLMVEDEKIIQTLKSMFGQDAYYPDGKLNRKHIASIVFSDPALLERLNKIIHPAVFIKAETWLQKFADQPYTIHEAAILYESGMYRNMARVICVYAPEELRIKRVCQRDGTKPVDVKTRIDKQMSEGLKLSLADHIIWNDGSQLLLPQVLRLHKIFSDNKKTS